MVIQYLYTKSLGLILILKKKKERFIDEYLKCSNNCTISTFAKEDNIEFQTFQKWIKQRNTKQNDIKSINH